MALWERCRADGRGIIAVSGHIGSIEVFAGAYAQQGIPTYGLADDSAFPELFDLLNRSRARWGVTIIPWRHLRDIFRVLRQPCALGMVVDWGYRPDDVPVRLFGAWTTLPVGPALLAARTGAVIVPVVARRQPTGRYRPVMYEPIEVADGSRPQPCARHAGHRRCARGHGRRGAGAVVHVQADVAGTARPSAAAPVAAPRRRVNADAEARPMSCRPGARAGRAPDVSSWRQLAAAHPARAAPEPGTAPRLPAPAAAARAGTSAARPAHLPDGLSPSAPGSRWSCRHRRAQVRRNLERVCAWLVANGMASPRVRRPRAADRVRSIGSCAPPSATGS